MAEATSSVIQFDPLRNDTNIAAFKALSKIIRTSIGPQGKLKIMQNADGGHVTVTSSSQRLYQSLSVKNTILKLIVSSVKTHLKIYGNAGLMCTLLILELIQNSIDLTYSLPLVGKLYQIFGKLYIDCLNEPTDSVWSLNLSNLSHLQCFISSILDTKPGCLLTEENEKHISTLLLKAFLNTIPSSGSTVYSNNIHFLTLEGVHAMQSKLFSGLLIKFESSDIILQKLKTTENLKLVLLTFSLSGDLDFPTNFIEIDGEISVWEMTLKYLQDFVQNLITMGINIVACQKVIHPKLRKNLEDNNILVLERLGSETSKNLQLLGIPAISHTVPSLEIKSGIVSVSDEKIGNACFLLLTNKEKPFSTLLISSYNEETVSETKAVCKQIIDALFRLLKSQKLCCGAGCTEIYTCHNVESKVKAKLNEISEETGCSSIQVLAILETFLQSLYNLSLSYHQGSLLNFVTEMKFKHLWKMQQNGEFPKGNIKCMCGKYCAESVGQTMWKVLSRTANDNLPNFKSEEPISDNKTNSVDVADELICKINALSVAFECASMLLKTSLCISSSS